MNKRKISSIPVNNKKVLIYNGTDEEESDH